jgi:hypothetical protein
LKTKGDKFGKAVRIGWFYTSFKLGPTLQVHAACNQVNDFRIRKFNPNLNSYYPLPTRKLPCGTQDGI